MGYHSLEVFVLLAILTTCARNTYAGISEEDKEAIEKGLEAGKDLAEVLKDGEFQNSLKKLGTNIAPFLGAVGPLVGLALAFIPTGDSPELAYMKREFKEVNSKLDIITLEFQEVKNAIDWSTIEVSYGSYERKIRAAEANLNRIYDVEGQARMYEQKNFINQYENDFDNSLLKLYDAIMFDDHIFSKNILDAAVKQTKYHKRKVEQFSLGLVQLLVQAIEIQVSYYGLKEWNADHLVKEWTSKMNSLKNRLQSVSNEVKQQYKTQLKTDADNLILLNRKLSNKDLMNKIYDFVKEKYDWRYWFVAAYSDVKGYDKHTLSVCGGQLFLHKHGKSIVIASQNKVYSSRFKKTDATKLLEDVEKDVINCKVKASGGRALALVNDVKSKTGRSCVPYALKMAVTTGRGLWFRSWNNHRAYRKIKTFVVKCGFTFWQYDVVVFG